MKNYHIKRFILLNIFIILSIISNAENNFTFITEEYPPISFTKNGKADGLAVEIVNEILKRKNINTKINIWPWPRAYQVALTHPNCALFSVAKTKQREKLFKWVGPIFEMEVSFYVKKDSTITIKSMDDAKKLKSIGTCRDAFDEQTLKNLGFSNLEPTSSYLLNIKKLMHNRIDVINLTNITARPLLKEAGFDINDIKKLYTFMNVDNYIAFSKDTPDDIIASWQSILDEMKKEGLLEKLQKKWLE